MNLFSKEKKCFVGCRTRLNLKSISLEFKSRLNVSHTHLAPVELLHVQQSRKRVLLIKMSPTNVTKCDNLINGSTTFYINELAFNDLIKMKHNHDSLQQLVLAGDHGSVFCAKIHFQLNW